MGFYLSPNVFLKETDLSQIIPAIATSIGGIVGASNKGPSNKPTLVTTTKQFIDLFGEPDPSVSYLHYSALAFLQESKQLYVVRVHNGATYSGVVVNKDSAPVAYTTPLAPVTDPDAFDFTAYTDPLFAVFAANEGAWGNDVDIKITNVKPSEYTFDIEVYYTKNGVTTRVESWTVSRQHKKDGNGKQLYLEDKINGNSNYIYVVDNTAEADTVLPKYTNPAETLGTGDGTTTTFAYTATNPEIQPFSISITDTVETFVDDGNGRLVGDLGGSGTVNYVTGAITVTFNTAPANGQVITLNYYTAYTGNLANGSNGAAVSNADVINGWDLFSNPDEVDVRILINGGYTDVTVQQKIKDICESRKDCIGVLDLPSDKQKPQDAIYWRKNIQNFNSSYVALYGPDLKVYDSFNAQYLHVPPSGYVASIYARTDSVAYPWYAPAGLNRGLVSVLDVKYRYVDGDRDAMYPLGINTIRFFPGQGIAVWGQRTEQYEASALDRVNVRRLLIVLEKSISTALYYKVFELNNEFTRLQITHQISRYLETIKRRHGVYDYRVVCDETNNTPAVIDANELHVDVYIKPERVAEFVQLQMVITSTDASFDELIGTGGNF